MSIPGSSSPLFFQTAGADAAFTLEKSVRFNDDDSAYLNRTPSSAGNRKTWTWAGWIKRSSTGNQRFFTAGANGTYDSMFQFVEQGSHSQLEVWNYQAGDKAKKRTKALFRDFSAWYHVVVSCTSSTLKIYVNGTEADYESGASNVDPDGSDWSFNSTVSHTIGKTAWGSEYFNGYLADVYWIDGQAKDPTDFGAFDDNGVWQAAAYSGSFGTNGFHLFDFANESGIGNDSSGNDNDWTVNNLSNVVGNGNWISQVVTTGGSRDYDSSYGVPQMFDNSTSTEMLNGGGTSSTWTPVGGLAFSSSFKMAAYDQDGGSITFNWSGGSYTWTLPTSNNTYPLTELSSYLTSPLTSITWSTPNIQGPYVYEVQVDGVRLVDNQYTDTDVLFDVPTNGTQSDTGAGGEVSGNYATWNPLVLNKAQNSTASLSNGNLDFNVSSSGYAATISTIAVGSSGKYYCEISFEGTKINSTNYAYLGVVPASSQQEFASSDNEADMHRALNALSITASHSLTRSAIGTGTNNTNADWNTSTGYQESDVIGIAIDLDNNVLAFYKNGTTLGTYPHSLQSGEQYFVFAEDWANGNDITKYILNAGQRGFAYAAPSGFKALCTTNLPTPVIAKGSNYFAAKTYTGNAGTQAITGLEFSPDFLWIKNRADSSGGAHRLFDTIRGTNSTLYSNLDLGPTSPSNSLTSFDSNGFTVGSGNFVNGSGDGMIAWAWDAGTSTASNTDGDITSQVRASQTAGFSIVKYSGSGTDGDTVGHGLNAKPESIWIKGLKDGDDWQIYHSGLGGPQYQMFLNVDGSRQTRSAVLNSTEPTSSVFTLGNYDDSNDGSTDYIAYCFAPVAGYSAFGSYTGDGTDKKFIYLGFRPAFVLIKRTDTGAWVLIDSARSPSNEFTNWLRPNESEAESTNNKFDIVSNGFVLRKNDSFTNQSNQDFIYFAFAENPFQANGGLAR